MAKKHIIVSESKRPFWQLLIATFSLTAAIAFIIVIIYQHQGLTRNHVHTLTLLIMMGVGFCFKKSVYIDLENSRFRSTFEVGPIKLGEWKTIHNFEYVSVFHQPLVNGNMVFEVNLWYDTNKHWELYEKNNPTEAFDIAYEISEYLQIDLLDATVPNDYKIIDKNELKKNLRG